MKVTRKLNGRDEVGLGELGFGLRLRALKGEGEALLVVDAVRVSKDARRRIRREGSWYRYLACGGSQVARQVVDAE